MGRRLEDGAGAATNEVRDARDVEAGRLRYEDGSPGRERLAVSGIAAGQGISVRSGA